jgi:hypothetical protein
LGKLSILRGGKSRALGTCRTWIAPNFGPASPEETRGIDFWDLGKKFGRAVEMLCEAASLSGNVS